MRVEPLKIKVSEYDRLRAVNSRNRKNLEWLVKISLDEAIISISRGRELLGFQYMEEMREWLNETNT